MTQGSTSWLKNVNKKILDSFVIFKAKVILDYSFFTSWKGICPWCIKETKFITDWPGIQCSNCKEYVTIINEDETGINVRVEKYE